MRPIGLAVVLPNSLVVTPLAAAEEVAATANAVDQAFVPWMTQHGVSRGTLAVARGNRLVIVKGHGGLQGDRRVLIASLAKVWVAREG